MDFGFILEGSWLAVYAVAAFFVVLLIAMGLRRLDRRRGWRLSQFIELRLAPRLLQGADAGIRRPLVWFTVLGCVFLAIALAQPHWGRAWQEVSQRSHDVLVCLDTSESMLAEDMAPGRLTRAKHKIETLLERSGGDRFGLIVFSGAAELLAPITLDHGYVRSILNAVDTDTISLEGTNISAALHEAIDVYKAEDKESGNADRDTRAILLVSDGEDVSGDAVAAAREATKYARVFVIGVGDPRGSEVMFRDRFQRRRDLQEEGEVHLSRLDEATLKRIAQDGGGAYIRSTASNNDVEEIQGIIERLASREVQDDVRMRLVNRYQWPLAIAVLCFMLEGFWLAGLPYLRFSQQRRSGGEEASDYA